VGSWCDRLSNLREVHRLGVEGRQDQGRALALLGADRAEDVDGGGALVTGSAWAGAALFAYRRVILFFWPIRASSENQISILSLNRIFPLIEYFLILDN